MGRVSLRLLPRPEAQPSPSPLRPGHSHAPLHPLLVPSPVDTPTKPLLAPSVLVFSRGLPAPLAPPVPSPHLHRTPSAASSRKCSQTQHLACWPSAWGVGVGPALPTEDTPLLRGSVTAADGAQGDQATPTGASREPFTVLRRALRDQLGSRFWLCFLQQAPPLSEPLPALSSVKWGQGGRLPNQLWRGFSQRVPSPEPGLSAFSRTARRGKGRPCPPDKCSHRHVHTTGTLRHMCKHPHKGMCTPTHTRTASLPPGTGAPQLPLTHPPRPNNSSPSPASHSVPLQKVSVHRSPRAQPPAGDFH